MAKKTPKQTRPHWERWSLSSHTKNNVKIIVEVNYFIEVNTSAMILLTCTLSINAENMTYSNRQWVHKPSVCIRTGGLNFTQSSPGKFSQPQRLKRMNLNAKAGMSVEDNSGGADTKKFFCTFPGRNAIFSYCYNLNCLLRDYATEWNFPHFVISKSSFDHFVKLDSKPGLLQ